MSVDTFNLNDKLYSNYNNILLEIINELNQIKINSKEDSIIKTLTNIIIKINNIINNIYPYSFNFLLLN